MKNKERKLYKIGHLTKILGITHRSIRYYDQYGLLPHVKRSSGNVRLFDEEDVELIKKIRNMQSEEFLPLNVIKEKLFGKKSDITSGDKAIVTDSTALLSEAVKAAAPIHILPLSISIEGQTYLDGIDITPSELWDKSQQLEIDTLTSPPAEDVFVKKYLELHQQGIKEIYSIHLSSKLSATYQIALQASHKVADKVKVVVIDSKSTGAGLGLFVQLIGEAIHEQNSSKEIQLLISKNLPLIFDMMVVNSLQFLANKGKLSDLSPTQMTFMGKLFELKPVMTLKNGELEILECSKTKQDAVDLMIDLLDREIQSRGGYVKQISVIYNYLYGEALEIINRIKSSYPYIPLYMDEGSSILSVYVGNESIGISII